MNWLRSIEGLFEEEEVVRIEAPFRTQKIKRGKEYETCVT